MAFEFKLPDIGEGVVDGEIVKWLIKPGDEVEEDQPMVEVMTDKATVVIPSPRAGKVLETRGAEGDIAKVHEVLVVIQEAGQPSAPPPPVASAPPPPVRTEPAPLRAETMIPEPVEPEATALPTPQTSGETISVTPRRKALAAPATRRLARELGVDITTVFGSGPGGRVTSDDVRRRHASPVATPEPDERATIVPATRPDTTSKALVAPQELGEQVVIRGMRKKIWENMARSAHTAAHFTFVEECNCDALVELRARFNARLGEGEGKLSYLPFILKAIIASLRKFPDLNGHVDEASMSFSRRRDFHLGMAVATDRGLMVPVIRHADRLSLLALSSEITRLADLCREGRISMDDLGGSTFTITSLGKEGGIFATPVINHPEVAILGVHKMSKQAVVIDDQIVIRPMMNLSVSFDHRLVDGHVGAAFCYSVVKLLENPDRLIMEMV